MVRACLLALLISRCFRFRACQRVLFSYVSCEARVPKDHPLRPIRQIVDEALAALSPEFEKLYARFGRPSIPPERLLASLGARLRGSGNGADPMSAVPMPEEEI